jgi:hypothetical protein
MPDIRDIVGQTSALEKIPSIDQRNQEVRAGKLAEEQLAENLVKNESVNVTKETEDKLIRSKEEREKESGRRQERKAKEKVEREDKEETKDLKGSDIIEVDEGKIVDIKV